MCRSRGHSPAARQLQVYKHLTERGACRPVTAPGGKNPIPIQRPGAQAQRGRALGSDGAEPGLTLKCRDNEAQEPMYVLHGHLAPCYFTVCLKPVVTSVV